MKTILVTGGLGYVGSRLSLHLLDKGYNVKVIDLCLYGKDGLAAIESKGSDVMSRFELIEKDIRDPEAVKQAMQGTDAVIHLAAISNDPTGEVDSVLTRQVNFDAVGLLLAVAKKEGVKRFINASSSSVFGVKSEDNISEMLEPEPITQYSTNKMLGEWLVKSASSENFVTTSIRPATVCGYSPRQRFDLTVNKLTADAIRKGVITVHGGQQRRPNVGMTDMINIYGLLLETAPEKINGKTFNFGFENHKIIDIAEIVKEELADLRDVEINVTEQFDQRDYHISSDKILKELNYEPVSSIRNEVKNLRQAMETEFENIEADKHYNMKVMKLDRSAEPYKFLAN